MFFCRSISIKICIYAVGADIIRPLAGFCVGVAVRSDPCRTTDMKTGA
jgi:hypothetical protein